MSSLRLTVLSLIFAIICGRSVSQPAGSLPLAQAAELNEQGRFGATVALLEPELKPDRAAGSDAATGAALLLLGTAYEYLGAFGEARRCFEDAIRVLGADRRQVGLYASALDNLGALNVDLGRLDESTALRTKARDLYASIGDHPGVARAACNLALIAALEGHGRRARRLLDEGFDQERLASPASNDDLSSMYSIKSTLESRRGDYRAALAAIQQAIELWERGSHAGSFQTAIGYALRGRVYANLGDYARARGDFQAALGRLRDVMGTSGPLYLKVQVGYAEVLRHAGDRQAAAQMEEPAKAMLNELQRRSCPACTVNVQALR